MTSTRPDAPHALYRFFDADDTLLYIGLTNDPGSRWKQHSKAKPWWLDVTRVTIEHFPSQKAVQLAEIAAIHAEQPLYNIVHNLAQRSTRRRSKRPAILHFQVDSNSDPARLGAALSSALDDAQRALGAIMDAVDETENGDFAYRVAAPIADHLIDVARSITTASARIRSSAVARIRDQDGLSLAELGERLGFTKQRAAAIIRAHAADLEPDDSEVCEPAVAALEKWRAVVSDVDELHDEAMAGRDRAVAAIWREEGLSLAELAARTGISKARADQIVREQTGRPTQREPDPTARAEAS